MTSVGFSLLRIDFLESLLRQKTDLDVGGPVFEISFTAFCHKRSESIGLVSPPDSIGGVSA